MQTSRFELVQCWQDERVDQVFNKEAASVDRATFLATHMPFHNLEYRHGLQQIADKGEEAFLRELQRCASEDLHVFVVIQGIPGTGKSHLIRWLKERYPTQENQSGECVLFIERAQSSLSGTLEQIIRSGLFDETTMRKQLEKLQVARTALSEDALANTLLAQLMNACTEDPSIELLPWLARNDGLASFLLDLRVREELKRPGGPIDRLVRFLREGPRPGFYTSEVPQFEEQDFDFKVNVLREIQGYVQAKQLAERLSGDDRRDKRQELASLLNQCTRYAIGRATALTGDDFKQVFSDLRRHLYQQGRSLALFIEDITVFTGIDRGLLDVLITQHKGESGQELCRLISVVGITDSYYRDQVPDNIKERISYHITLSSENTSLALTNPQALENLASRYLNATRLPQEELITWVKNGADAEDLPNACNFCPWQVTCHSAFGTYTLYAGSEHEQQIGLYPFNSQSLNTFYQHIDPTKSRQTQRSFLYNVLHYMLQSHGTRLKQHAFPPPLSDLGGEFTEFSLTTLLQQKIIQTQGGIEWRRIVTLLAIWGNRTVDAVEELGKAALVGNLPREVFLAFGLPAIEGDRLTQPAQGPAVAMPDRPATIPLSQRIATSTQANTASGTSINAPSTTEMQSANDKLKKYRDDIASWLEGGSLQYYGEYIDILIPFIRLSIDWDFYRISAFQVEEVLKGRRNIHLEGQVGQTQAAYVLILQRDFELAAVIQGLIELKELGASASPAMLGGYLSQFSIWINRHELEIVDFVRQPNYTSPDALPLLQIILLDCLLLACLQGKLKASYRGTQELFLDLVRFCKQTSDDIAGWESQVKQAPDKHSSRWASLMKRFTPNDIKDICKNCLQLLNCSQGGSTEVKFVDAATGIRILQEFRKGRWQLPDPCVIDKSYRESWARALDIYAAFQEHFGSVVRSEQEAIKEQLKILEFYTGQDAYADIFRAIANMIQIAQESKRGMAFEVKKQFTATGLQTIVRELQRVFDMDDGESFILRCSLAGERIDEIKKYIEYFKLFISATEKMRPSQERLTKLRLEAEAVSAHEVAQKLYQDISQVLLSLNQVGVIE